MNEPIPSAIFSRIFRLGLCIAAVSAFGILWGVISRDTVTLGLSAAVAVAGTLKGLALYRTAEAKKYEVLVGTLLSIRSVPGLNRMVITILDSDGSERQICIAGKHKMTEGICYRLYFQLPEPLMEDLPPRIRPAQALLGYEEA